MNPWNYVYAVLVLIVLYIMFPTQERMTNADLISTLKTFGTQAPPPRTAGPSEVPIYGPTAEKPEDIPGSSSGSATLVQPLIGQYPDIFGPDSVIIPGQPKTKPKSPSGDVYDFNPDFQKAFPTSGPPEPYLTDFSKLHH